MTEDRTHRQWEAQKFAERFKKMNERDPTYQELANGLGLKSRSAAFRLLNHTPLRTRVRILEDRLAKLEEVVGRLTAASARY